MNDISLSATSFNGLRIDGTVKSRNLKKLGNFASKVENKNFINYLGSNLKTDIILDNEITKVSFAHQQYGNLDKYGVGTYNIENVFRDVMDIINNIKTALKKAEKDFQKYMEEKEKTKRGC